MSIPNRRVGPVKKSVPAALRGGTRKGARKASSTANSAASWLVLEARKRPVRECERCMAIFFDGHWHKLKSKAVVSVLKKEVAVLHDVCEACRIESAAHGPVGAVGEVRIAEVPERIRRDVLRTVANVGRTAISRDPEERIISIDEVGKGYRVTTTENQLAVRIGKKLDSAFKGGRIAIRYSERDMPIMVRWTPPSA